MSELDELLLTDELIQGYCERLVTKDSIVLNDVVKAILEDFLARVKPIIEKQEKIKTLQELRGMWIYELAAGTGPVMSVGLDKWIKYCRKAGIKDDWWELRKPLKERDNEMPTLP